MADENNSQLEMFSKTTAYDQQETGRGTFFGYVRAYEKMILLILGMIVTGIVSFSFGVEKGKSIAASRANSRFDSAAVQPKTQPVAAGLAANQIAPGQKQGATAPASSKAGVRPEDSGAYTIQLASFNNRSNAQKELTALKKKGFSALILSRGKYVVLCVGSFSSEAKAQGLLSEFKKRYKTCYVRRL
ncbi:MAG: SPOR domain-containing protein [Candidatus Omnitrophota bacterium]|nr:SPOR domain-containing protein [Candidatus Omnitrophota bacterium]